MRTTLFLISLFYFFTFLSTATLEEEHSLTTVMREIEVDYHLFEDTNYTDLPLDEKVSSAPCSLAVPGLSSVGLMITYITVSVLSVIGNSVVIFVICSMEKSKTSTDIYLMQLAVADLLFALTLPFWAVYVYSQWIFGTFLCKLLSGLQETSFYGGVFLLACISVDRYLAIVKATRALPQRRQMVWLVCGVVWMASALLSLPVVLQREAMMLEDQGDQMLCYESLTVESGNRWRVCVRVLRHTLGFFVPLGVMVVCYGGTAGTLFRARNGQKHKAMRVIMAVVFAFVLCWLPYNVSVLLDTLIRGQSLGGVTCSLWSRVELSLNVTQVMAFMHCALNPVLYAFVGQKFRNQLLVALYKHGMLSQKAMIAYRRGSANSSGSLRSRNTFVTV
ncbi:C-X-C chemokine receptor type 1 [Osmerus eperlanus]|uniref:C-X-C chemokine receptor type 1 n=1 Tax=Osmerus eperlanus TaxID=29151 RepID=UPI002E102531